jgi:hypothetical protein
VPSYEIKGYFKHEVLKVNLLETNTAMTTTSIRKKLMNFIADADDKKVKGMYMLFEEEIEKDDVFKLTEEHIKILDEERSRHLTGKSKSYNWGQAKQIIRGKRKL